ncbi:hypothetical protein ACH4VR_12000 [Streptomyces sp. NPDC020883]|uniref:hypothetical protein n=1 Tax=unclassified Streptomyces TaxID=2593676 RepID=UPI0034E2EE90
MRRRRGPSAVLLTAALALPLLGTAACSPSSPSGSAAPAASSTATPQDQLPQMRKKADGAQQAVASADANGNADNAGN